MDKPIRIPRHQTALMQHIQRLVSHGHFYWCSDEISRNKLPAFIDKWQGYSLRADAPARAYRKQCGRASVHLCVDSDFANSILSSIHWWMLSTSGKEGLISDPRPPANVRDCRTQEGRITFNDYELVSLTKIVKSGNKVRRVTTWTWRLTRHRFHAWEALLVSKAKNRDLAGLEKAINCLKMMPLFSGIRYQVILLLAEANKVLTKVGAAPIEHAQLPFMRMVSLWSDDAAL